MHATEDAHRDNFTKILITENDENSHAVILVT